MKISCDIIRDLLPLYAENMTSPASNEMVEAHLGECEGCKGYLAALRRPVPVPEKVELKSLGKVRKSIRKRAVFTAVTALFLIASILAGAIAWLYHPIWLTADEAILGVEAVEHGGLQLTVPAYVTHSMRHSAPNGMTYAFETNHLAKLVYSWAKAFYPEGTRPKIEDIHALMETPDGSFMPYHPELADEYGVMYNMTDNSHWYWNVYEGRFAATLWDAGHPTPVNKISASAHCITKEVFWAAVVICAVFIVIAFAFKYSRLGQVAPIVSLLAGSHVLAALLMTDGRFFNIQWVGDPYPIRAWIWMLTTLFAVTAVLTWQLIRIRAQDKL